MNTDKSEDIPLLDSRVLNGLSVMFTGSDSIESLIEDYLNDTRKLVTELQESISMGNNKLTAELAHALDGGSRSIGAMRIAHFADQLCRQAQHNNLSTDAINELTKIHTATQKAVNDYLI